MRAPNAGNNSGLIAVATVVSAAGKAAVVTSVPATVTRARAWPEVSRLQSASCHRTTQVTVAAPVLRAPALIGTARPSGAAKGMVRRSMSCQMPPQSPGLEILVRSCASVEQPPVSSPALPPARHIAWTTPVESSASRSKVPPGSPRSDSDDFNKRLREETSLLRERLEDAIRVRNQAVRECDEARKCEAKLAVRLLGVQEQLTCGVCLLPLCWPVLLGCGHAFCSSCVAQWEMAMAQAGRPLTCPGCRAPAGLLTPARALGDVCKVLEDTNAARRWEDEERTHRELEAGRQRLRSRVAAGLLRRRRHQQLQQQLQRVGAAAAVAAELVAVYGGGVEETSTAAAARTARRGGGPSPQHTAATAASHVDGELEVRERHFESSAPADAPATEPLNIAGTVVTGRSRNVRAAGEPHPAQAEQDEALEAAGQVEHREEDGTQEDERVGVRSLDIAWFRRHLQYRRRLLGTEESVTVSPPVDSWEELD